MDKSNLFGDLIEELRDENLLETVIDLSKAKGDRSASGVPTEMTVVGGRVDSGISGVEHGFDAVPDAEPESESDFYRKRAIDEISSLQMVGHVLSGIEREHMKTVPGSYDDLGAKKALHQFLQVQTDSTSVEYAEAEFKLMHETEAWSTALGRRDEKVSVSNLRRFCENSRPALSSQALMALGRFYRNASYSELSRAKFDLIMTRLFTRDAGDERRRMLFSQDEMVGHLKTLYANWASIALYCTDEPSSRTRAVVAGFEDCVAEAEGALIFEQLIRKGFFDTVQEFKEGTGEMFFTPEIVAASIDSNVRIGNKFVDLVQAEREMSNPETVEQRYGYEYDQIISDAAGKTLHMLELLKNLPEPPISDEPPSKKIVSEDISNAAVKDTPAPPEGKELFTVNKWLLAATILAIIATGSAYFWSS